jgi:hypothetical protein
VNGRDTDPRTLHREQRSSKEGLMSTNQLTEFRSTYLRAIAEAWADPDGFGKELTGGNPASALKDRFGYIWP